MAGKLTDYYCAKKAEESKDYDDTSVICKRREEQLSHTVSDNSTVLMVTSPYTYRYSDSVHNYRVLL